MALCIRFCPAPPNQAARKVFLLEKRLPPGEAKNFYILGLGLRSDHGHQKQKFFGSFFQKKNRLLALPNYSFRLPYWRHNRAQTPP
jgi:hypothetical protein